MGEQCKAFSSEDTTESDLDNDFNLTTHNDEPYSSKLDCCKAFSSDDMLESESDTEVLKYNEVIETNDTNNLKIAKKETPIQEKPSHKSAEKETPIQEDPSLHNFTDNESLNSIQNLVDTPQINQNETNAKE